MIGFAIGGTLGRLADKVGSCALLSRRPCRHRIHHGCVQRLLRSSSCADGVIGMPGSSVSFGPLVADTTHWVQTGGALARDRSQRQFLAGTICAGAHWASTNSAGATPISHRVVCLRHAAWLAAEAAAPG